MTARMTPLQPRLQSPDGILPDLRAGIQALIGTVFKSGLPRSTAELVHLRVSQVNGCAPCIDSGWRTAKKAGESDERGPPACPVGERRRRLPEDPGQARLDCRAQIGRASCRERV